MPLGDTITTSVPAESRSAAAQRSSIGEAARMTPNTVPPDSAAAATAW